MMKNFLTFLVLGLMLSACGRQPTAVVSAAPKAATVSANACVNHPVGENFASSDGCNSCSCDASGQMTCTLMFCGPINN